MKLHSLTACFLIFDIGVLILNRYILLDPILLFFISGSFFSMSQFRTIQEPFTTPWWTWLPVTKGHHWRRGLPCSRKTGK